VHWNLNRNTVIALLTVATFAAVFAVERINPLQPRWSMTRASLIERDLPFIGLAVVVEQIATTGASLVAGVSPSSHTTLDQHVFRPAALPHVSCEIRSPRSPAPSADNTVPHLRLQMCAHSSRHR
jgi:hypothetical protein